VDAVQRNRSLQIRGVSEDDGQMGGGKMSLIKTIGFTGLAGSGKTYAATWFRFRSGKGSVWSFASEIKSIATRMGWDGQKDDRGRKMLQDIGSAGRAYDPWTWVAKMPTDHPIIIDDVRFINEAEAIKDAGGIVVRIIRPGLTAMDHESEIEQSHIIADYTLINDKEIEEELEKLYEREMGTA
jgi:hypothetical protein